MPWKTRTCKELKSDLQGAERYLSDYKSHIKKFAETGEEYLSDEIDFAGKRSEHFVDQVYDGLPDIELSIKKAKEVMGEDFYGPEEYEEIFGEKMYVERMGRVPFKVSELRKAKEFGMKLIGRYDSPDDMDGVAMNKLQKLGFDVPSSFDTGTLPRPVKREWVFVSPPNTDHAFAYTQVQNSLSRASDILHEEVHPETKAEITQWYGKIHQDIRDGKMREAEGLLNDLIANRVSNGARYLLSASEKIYDALLVSGNDLHRFQDEVQGITGTLVKRGNIQHFLELNFNNKSLSVEFVPVYANVKGIRSQIRV